MKHSFSRALMTGSDFAEPGLRRENLVAQAENLDLDAWPWSNEEGTPFEGLPPLPKVFREPSLSQSPLCETKEQELVKKLEGSCSSLQNKITWVQGELLSLRLADLVLFKQLYTLALEIQDLKELQQEMEDFFKEELFAGDQRQAGEAGAASIFRFAATAELII